MLNAPKSVPAFLSFSTGGEAGAKTRGFLRDLGWVAVGYGLSRLLTLAVGVLAGRWLGPSEYGVLNLGLAAGSFLQPLVSWGIPMALVRYASASPEKRNAYFATGGRLFLALAATGTAMLFLVRRTLAGAAGLAPELVWGGVLYVLGYSVFFFMTSLPQAEGRFRLRAGSEIVFAVLYAAAFLILYRVIGPDHRAPLFAIGIGYAAAGLVLLPVYGRRLAGPVEGPLAGPMLSYGVLWMLDLTCISIQAFFLRFVVHRWMSAGDVGVISVYTLASLTVAFNLGGVFQTVFVPAASAHRDREALWDRLLTAFRRGFLPLGVLFMLAQRAALWLVGEAYPLRWDVAFLMAVAAALCFYQLALGWLVSSSGVAGYRRTVIVRVASSVLAVGLALGLVPRWGLAGAAWSYALAYLANFLLLLPARKTLAS